MEAFVDSAALARLVKRPPPHPPPLPPPFHTYITVIFVKLPAASAKGG